MLWELVSYVSEGGIDFGVLLGLDFEVLFIDLVCGDLLISHDVLVDGIGWDRYRLQLAAWRRARSRDGTCAAYHASRG